MASCGTYVVHSAMNCESCPHERRTQVNEPQHAPKMTSLVHNNRTHMLLRSARGCT